MDDLSGAPGLVREGERTAPGASPGSEHGMLDEIPESEAQPLLTERHLTAAQVDEGPPIVPGRAVRWFARWLRIGGSAILAFVVYAALWLGLVYRGPGLMPSAALVSGSTAVVFAVASFSFVTTAAFVFAVLATPAPQWYHGLCYGTGLAALAMASSAQILESLPDSQTLDPASTAAILIFFVGGLTGILGGLLGGALAARLARILARRHRDGRRRRAKPWHVGAAIVLCALLVGAAAVRPLFWPAATVAAQPTTTTTQQKIDMSDPQVVAYLTATQELLTEGREARAKVPELMSDYPNMTAADKQALAASLAVPLDTMEQLAGKAQKIKVPAGFEEMHSHVLKAAEKYGEAAKLVSEGIGTGDDAKLYSSVLPLQEADDEFSAASLDASKIVEQMQLQPTTTTTQRMPTSPIWQGKESPYQQWYAKAKQQREQLVTKVGAVPGGYAQDQAEAIMGDLDTLATLVNAMPWSPPKVRAAQDAYWEALMDLRKAAQGVRGTDSRTNVDRYNEAWSEEYKHSVEWSREYMRSFEP